MPVEHRIQITVSEGEAASMIPETAIVRLISLLPVSWNAYLTGLTPDRAQLSLTLPEGMHPAEAEAVIDKALRQPELRGWSQTPPRLDTDRV